MEGGKETKQKKPPCFADTQIWVFQDGVRCTALIEEIGQSPKGSCHLEKVKVHKVDAGKRKKL